MSDTITVNLSTSIQTLCANLVEEVQSITVNILEAQNGSNVSALTGNWQDAYTTVQANSAQWAIDTVGSNVSTLSGNWQDTYTIVQAKSANWDNSYNTVNSLSSRWTNTYLALTGGSITGSLSVGNLSSSGFTQSLGTFTAGAGYPTIPSGVRAAGVSILGFSNNFSLVGGNNVTNNTRKFTRWGAAHYTNAEEPLLMMIGDSVTSSTADLYIGGGTGIANTFQTIRFYTAASATTLTGSERMRIDATGKVGIGIAVPTQALDVVGSIKASTPIIFPTYSMSLLPTASSYIGGMIYISDESGGGTMAFSDGANWRRVQDRAIAAPPA